MWSKYLSKPKTIQLAGWTISSNMLAMNRIQQNHMKSIAHTKKIEEKKIFLLFTLSVFQQNEKKKKMCYKFSYARSAQRYWTQNSEKKREKRNDFGKMCIVKRRDMYMSQSVLVQCTLSLNCSSRKRFIWSVIEWITWFILLLLIGLCFFATKHQPLVHTDRICIISQKVLHKEKFLSIFPISSFQSQ